MRIATLLALALALTLAACRAQPAEPEVGDGDGEETATSQNEHQHDPEDLPEAAPTDDETAQEPTEHDETAQEPTEHDETIAETTEPPPTVRDLQLRQLQTAPPSTNSLQADVLHRPGLLAPSGSRLQHTPRTLQLDFDRGALGQTP